MNFRPSAPRSTIWLAALFALAAASLASAQIRVDLRVNRPLYIRFEPLIVTVTLTNVSGRELELADEGNYKWLSFQIEYVEEKGMERLVPPYNADYQLSPIQIGPGQSIKRLINLTPIYPMTEYGLYRIRATIYSRDFRKYFSSDPQLNVEITEGRTLWQQEVGVPGEDGENSTRTVTLLAHRLPKDTQLYIRIEDKTRGVVYCTHQLGRLLSFGKPEVELDAENNIHVLQYIAPKAFMYTCVALDGRVIDRKEYNTVKNKPSLKHDTAGGVQVVGGFVVDPNSPEAQAELPPPSVSERPVPLPTPEQ